MNELVNEGVNSVQTSEQRGERNDKLVNDKRGEHPQTSERSPLQTSESSETGESQTSENLQSSENLTSETSEKGPMKKSL